MIMLILNFIKRIQFLLSATNEHGVHSPFVYDYITKCLYAGTNIGKNKSWEILQKSIPYFGAERLALCGTYKQRTDLLSKQFPTVSYNQKPYDIIAIDVTDPLLMASITSKKSTIHNDTMVLVDNIHLNRNNLLIWKGIKENNEVTVTIDLYYCGLVFFRREQAKEHFKIRI